MITVFTCIFNQIEAAFVSIRLLIKNILNGNVYLYKTYTSGH